MSKGFTPRPGFDSSSSFESLGKLTHLSELALLSWRMETLMPIPACQRNEGNNIWKTLSILDSCTLDTTQQIDSSSKCRPFISFSFPSVLFFLLSYFGGRKTKFLFVCSPACLFSTSDLKSSKQASSAISQDQPRKLWVE